MSLILDLVIVVIAISLCIVAFLLISAGDLENFKKLYRPKARCSILPIISRYGDLITSPQELDFHLTGLKARLREKYQELESMKTKIHSKLDNLQKLDTYKKGCMEMQAHLLKIEDECKDLQQKIEYFKSVQTRIQSDLTPKNSLMGDADWMSTSKITT